MIIIGCPIYQRHWIIDQWFECIENQNWPLDNIGFAFEAVKKDTQTLEKIFEWQSRHPEVSVFDVSFDGDTLRNEEHNSSGVRRWNKSRYNTMVELRNSLLNRVRLYQPERFFSLDSDILLTDPNTISRLHELTEHNDIDAVNPLIYMTPTGNQFPGVMTWVKQDLSFALRQKEYPIGKVFRADVIMAAKMMMPKVYNEVNYSFHRQGEDLGWSKTAKEKGFKLFCASDTYATHIMSRELLKEFNNSGDSRYQSLKDV